MDRAGVGSATAAVVALKATEHAKSRLASFPDPLRRRLAWTMAVDTLLALSDAVDHLVVVSDQPALDSRLRRIGLSVEVRAEAGRPGMNAALNQGADVLRARGFRTVLACVGDLPALRATSVRRILDQAEPHSRSFVADASGVGTTMLITRLARLDPHFQGRSAAAHHTSGAIPLAPQAGSDSWADARRDVDTEIDLADAIHLGIGPTTSALIDQTTSRIGHYQVITSTEWTTDDATPVAVTASGHRVALPRSALSDGLRHVRLGQRLHAVIADRRVLSAWL